MKKLFVVGLLLGGALALAQSRETRMGVNGISSVTSYAGVADGGVLVQGTTVSCDTASPAGTGCVTNTNQAFAGVKTFTAPVIVDGGLTFSGAGSTVLKWDANGGNSWQIEGTPGSGSLRIGNNTSRYMALRFNDGYIESGFGVEINVTGSNPITKLWGNGRIDRYGTDTSASPGDAGVDRPCGIAAIPSGTNSATITNSLAFTTSQVFVQFLGDHGAARSWVVRGAGYFTVVLSSTASANTSFAWCVNSLL
jgi:hypothetical protein